MKVLAISSKGGHWIQLLRLKEVWERQEVVYATTDNGLHSHVKGGEFFTIIDANKTEKIKLMFQFFSVFVLLIRTRPDVIITTGASVGFFALFIGRFLKIKTVWVDSMANSEEMSLAGAKVGHFCDIWLTQWEHLAKPNGPHFKGRVF